MVHNACMLYFAYGSNMCAGRLRGRVPSATPVRVARLLNHSLRFHKRSDKDGSGKADAYFTGEPADVVWGVVFDIDPAEKASLDAHEGLGHGYVEKAALVIDAEGNRHSVFTYTAETGHIDPTLRPYSCYRRFVVEGARQHALSLFQVRNYADEFAAALEGRAVAAPAVEEEDETISVVADDIAQQSRDFVLKQIHQKLKGHGLAEFVGHLLNLMRR